MGEDVREVHPGLKGMRRHVSGEESLSISSGNRITEYRNKEKLMVIICVCISQLGLPEQSTTD